jgi:hypothetical protein
VVNDDGTLDRGTGIVATSRVGTGNYRVQADKDITGCAFIGNLGDSGSGAPSPGAIGTAQTAGAPDTVTVKAFRSQANGLTPSDEPFHLAIVC